MNTLLKPLYDYLRDLAPETATAKEAACDLGVSPTKIRAAAEELAKMGLANARAVGAVFRISAVAGAEPPAEWQSEKVHLVTKTGNKCTSEAENTAEKAPTTQKNAPKSTKPADADTTTAPETAAMPSEKAETETAKPAKRKPFTPNPTRGYEVQKGKVKIFLDRKAHSRVLTLSIEDLEELVNAVKKSA